FGLKSQWLDMTNYPFNPSYGLYLTVLAKKDPSPLLPESDEDTGVQQPGPLRGGNRPDGANPDAPTGPPAGGGQGQTRARGPVTVTIDWDGLGKRIVSVPGVPERQYSNLAAGSDGTVFYLQAGQNQAGPGGGGAELMRYKLSDRRAITFVNGVANGAAFTPYSVSADGKKLVYRAAGGGGGFGGGGAGGNPPAPSLFIIDADARTAPQAGTGRVNYSLRMYLDPTEEYKQIFNEMWRNQRDYL